MERLFSPSDPGVRLLERGYREPASMEEHFIRDGNIWSIRGIEDLWIEIDPQDAETPYHVFDWSESRPHSVKAVETLFAAMHEVSTRVLKFV